MRIIDFVPLKRYEIGEKMKENIHPKYQKCKVTCACGNTFETRSTIKEINVEICSECHPFYTGKKKLVDSGGRIEKFKRKYEKFNKDKEN